MFTDHPHQIQKTATRRSGTIAHATPEFDLATALPYAGLGLGAVSFLATFFVLPKLYAKNTTWNDMLPLLRQSGVRSISPREAYSKARSAVLLDVRLPDSYAQLAAERSVNVPLYLPIQEWDLPSIIRRLGFAFFGVAGTELNPNFVADVQAAVPRGREIVVLCESGGSIEAKKGNASGFQSRSLKAVYYLLQAGFTKVSYVEGGLRQWLQDDLPAGSGGEEDQDADSDDDGDAVVLAGAGKGLSLPFFK